MRELDADEVAALEALLWMVESVAGVQRGQRDQPASVPPKTCHARADFAVRLRTM